MDFFHLNDYILKGNLTAPLEMENKPCRRQVEGVRTNRMKTNLSGNSTRPRPAGLQPWWEARLHTELGGIVVPARGPPPEGQRALPSSSGH